jgi:hypothetical protein
MSEQKPNIPAHELSHAECSPSQVKGIILCPGKRRLRRQVPRGSSNYADEGTMLHEITETLIRERYSEYFKTPSPADVARYNTLDKEQQIAVDECLEYFESVLRELKLTRIIESIELETRTSLKWFGMPEVSGFVDVIIKSNGRRDIIDWKFGQGVPVYSIENDQLMSYAAGSFTSEEEMQECPDIYLHVVQPRLDYMEPWQLTSSHLFDWMKYKLLPAIEASRKDDAPCIPGEEQCRWCIGTNCKARAEKVMADAQEIFSKYVGGTEDKPIIDFDKDLIPDSEIAHMLTKAKAIDAFIKELAGSALTKCISGEGFPGYKAVEGRSFRLWRDDEDAKEQLLALAEDPTSDFEIEDLFESKFVSVAKAEKLSKDIKKEDWFKDLWYKSPGKPTLAKEDDKRKPFNDSATNVFAAYAK